MDTVFIIKGLFLICLGAVLAALTPEKNHRHKVLKSGLLGGGYLTFAVCVCFLFAENPLAVFVAAVFAYKGLNKIIAVVEGDSSC